MIMKTYKYLFWNQKTKSWVRDGFNLICTDGLIFELKTEEDIEIVEYVGIKDKFWKEIYEGCFLRFKNKKYPAYNGLYLIEWNEAEGAFEANKYEPYKYLPSCLWNRCQIVGNRFENPEMIKNTEKI